ncbi:hypothetical protein FF011L_12720 [Roseimaritima multifibrata]|uniref:YfiR family protein n=1 Tax=Roseimaritima multifibrata TaxID=1930274 RepID=A0A517MCC7_9BACT|nr:YfiR family protein [Roseimaritima multifibrata]QDS92525.1 hypothetical protein FF011L_12720 [Roseimaritima multifibrata]
MRFPAILTWLTLLGVLCAGGKAVGETPPAPPTEQETIVRIAKEDNIKAVYLYSFGRFTNWPDRLPGDDSPFRVGIVGPSGVQKSLMKIARKRTIHDRPIEVVPYQSAEDVVVDACDLLFVSSAIQPVDLTSLMLRVRGTSVLTVTESPSRPEGTVVNFVETSGAIQFEIDLEEAKRKSLAMDARLLRQGIKMLPSSPNQGP